MDTSGFNSIVKNYSCLTEDEYLSIKGLSYQYPYCQIINLLQARAAQDLGHPDKDKMLHYAAVYSTERAVLKHVMTAPRRERIFAFSSPVSESPPFIEDVVLLAETKEEEREQLIDEVVVPALDKVSLSGDDLRNDIYHELEKLQRLKKEFENSVLEFEKSGSGDTNLKVKTKSLKEPVSDPLIEEIKSTKKKLKVENPKQKEQNEIIDQFIKIQPTIPKAKPIESASDLSEDSGMFSDNIVSETLVDILLKQGKKDKAIEVLKKLIWKFPQKKAYFAAQIEDLKN